MPTDDWAGRTKSLLRKIEKLNIHKNNKRLLLEFYRELLINDYSEARIHKLLNHLVVLAKNFPELDFERVNKEDIKKIIAWVHERELSPETKKDYKIALRVFYKWLDLGSVKAKGVPERVANLSATVKKKDQKLPEDILTEEEVKLLIEHATNARTRCLISMLWETGARMGELINLKVKDIKPWRYGYQVILNGKTGSRRVPLIISEPYINEWIDAHPLKNSENWPDVWLWVHIKAQDHGKGKIIGEKADYHSLVREIKRVAKRAGIHKPVNPHNFRHSRATFMANYFTEAQMSQWFGWVPASRMPSRYVHLSGRDLDRTYAVLHGFEGDDEKKPKFVPKMCPRCELEKIAPDSKFCPRCGAPLDPRIVKEVEEAEGKVLEIFATLRDEDVLKMLEFITKLYRIARDDPDVAKIVRSGLVR